MKIEVSNDKSKLDIDVVHDFLSKSYWAKGRSKESIERSIENSICFGVYKGESQIGFARVLTDYVAFAYILDVFIIETERNNGYSSLLMKEILNFEETRNVEKWFLGTRDAQFLYRKFEFKEVTPEITWMQR